jgi:multiple sugar transport system ATP-binding protein
MKIRFVSCAKEFSTSRGPVEALRRIDLEVQDGEFFIFLGPSGCGKSTLLNLTAGLEKLTLGEIHFNDQIVDSPNKGIFVPSRERNVAMVFQSYALYPHLDVAANIAFPLQVAKEDKKKISKAVEEVAGLLQIGRLLDRKPGELSGGQRQRVAIARALVRRPRAFLLDEPLSNLDVQLRTDTRAELKQLQRKFGITTLYVTHDQTEAMTLGDRIALLKNGSLLQVGTPREMYEKPETPFAATFIGSPPMNLFPADVVEEEGEISALFGGVRLRVPEGKKRAFREPRVLLGIRPEHVSLRPEAAGSGPLPGLVQTVEPLGRENLYHVSTECGDLLVLGSEQRVDVGQRVHLSLDANRLHFFEAEYDDGEFRSPEDKSIDHRVSSHNTLNVKKSRNEGSRTPKAG